MAVVMKYAPPAGTALPAEATRANDMRAQDVIPVGIHGVVAEMFLVETAEPGTYEFTLTAGVNMAVVAETAEPGVFEFTTTPTGTIASMIAIGGVGRVLL
jgi:hypothetical protein